MGDCLYECLKEAHLEKYYTNFTLNGLTNCEELIGLSMQQYPDYGIVSMDDRLRLFKLIQIVKSVQAEGLYCKHEGHKKQQGHHVKVKTDDAPPERIIAGHGRVKKSAPARKIPAAHQQFTRHPQRKVLLKKPAEESKNVAENSKAKYQPAHKDVVFRKGSDSPVFHCKKTLNFDDSDLDTSSDEAAAQISSGKRNTDNEPVISDTGLPPDNGPKVQLFPESHGLSSATEPLVFGGISMQHVPRSFFIEIEHSASNKPVSLNAQVQDPVVITSSLSNQGLPQQHLSQGISLKSDRTEKKTSQVYFQEAHANQESVEELLQNQDSHMRPSKIQVDVKGPYKHLAAEEPSQNQGAIVKASPQGGVYLTKQQKMYTAQAQDQMRSSQNAVKPFQFKLYQPEIAPGRDHAYFPTSKPATGGTHIEKIYHNSGYNYGLPSSSPQKSRSKSTPGSEWQRRGRSNSDRIRVCVRKRPLVAREVKRGEADIVKVNSRCTVGVHEAKVAVDLSKLVHEHVFTYDEVFDAGASNEDVYARAVKPLLDAVFKRGTATCFAFGQTGSGKSHTLLGNKSVPGLYQLAGRDIINAMRTGDIAGQHLWVSYYEIYCSQLYDLLNKKKKLHVRENGKHRVCIAGLMETEVKDIKGLVQVVTYGNIARSTGVSGVNPNSSRSHAVLQLELRDNRDTRTGRMSFIDLAGSERASDVGSCNRQTRMEGAEINQSLLALKECIRSLDQGRGGHTPYRQSKLTHILRDSFLGNAATVMIANVAPSQSACENTLNTLRYADRVKELHHSPSSSQKMKQPTPLGSMENRAEFTPRESTNSSNSNSKSTPRENTNSNTKSTPRDGSSNGKMTPRDVTNTATTLTPDDQLTPRKKPNATPSNAGGGVTIFNPSHIQFASTPIKHTNNQQPGAAMPLDLSKVMADSTPESPIRGHKIRAGQPSTPRRHRARHAQLPQPMVARHGVISTQNGSSGKAESSPVIASPESSPHLRSAGDTTPPGHTPPSPSSKQQQIHMILQDKINRGEVVDIGEIIRKQRQAQERSSASHDQQSHRSPRSRSGSRSTQGSTSRSHEEVMAGLRLSQGSNSTSHEEVKGQRSSLGSSNGRISEEAVMENQRLSLGSSSSKSNEEVMAGHKEILSHLDSVLGKARHTTDLHAAHTTSPPKQHRRSSRGTPDNDPNRLSGQEGRQMDSGGEDAGRSDRLSDRTSSSPSPVKLRTPPWSRQSPANITNSAASPQTKPTAQSPQTRTSTAAASLHSSRSQPNLAAGQITPSTSRSSINGDHRSAINLSRSSSNVSDHSHRSSDGRHQTSPPHSHRSSGNLTVGSSSGGRHQASPPHSHRSSGNLTVGSNHQASPFHSKSSPSLYTAESLSGVRDDIVITSEELEQQYGPGVEMSPALSSQQVVTKSLPPADDFLRSLAEIKIARKMLHDRPQGEASIPSNQLSNQFSKQEGKLPSNRLRWSLEETYDNVPRPQPQSEDKSQAAGRAGRALTTMLASPSNTRQRPTHLRPKSEAFLDSLKLTPQTSTESDPAAAVAGEASAPESLPSSRRAAAADAAFPAHREFRRRPRSVDSRRRLLPQVPVLPNTWVPPGMKKTTAKQEQPSVEHQEQSSEVKQNHVERTQLTFNINMDCGDSKLIPSVDSRGHRLIHNVEGGDNRLIHNVEGGDNEHIHKDQVVDNNLAHNVDSGESWDGEPLGQVEEHHKSAFRGHNAESASSRADTKQTQGSGSSSSDNNSSWADVLAQSSGATGLTQIRTNQQQPADTDTDGRSTAGADSGFVTQRGDKKMAGDVYVVEADEGQHSDASTLDDVASLPNTHDDKYRLSDEPSAPVPIHDVRYIKQSTSQPVISYHSHARSLHSKSDTCLNKPADSITIHEDSAFSKVREKREDDDISRHQMELQQPGEPQVVQVNSPVKTEKLLGLKVGSLFSPIHPFPSHSAHQITVPSVVTKAVPSKRPRSTPRGGLPDESGSKQQQLRPKSTGQPAAHDLSPPRPQQQQQQQQQQHNIAVLREKLGLDSSTESRNSSQTESTHTAETDSAKQSSNPSGRSRSHKQHRTPTRHRSHDSKLHRSHDNKSHDQKSHDQKSHHNVHKAQDSKISNHQKVEAVQNSDVSGGDAVKDQTSSSHAKDGLIVAHEDELAAVTTLCKQEMKLLMSVKSNHLDFPEYVRELDTLLALKSRSIDTLRNYIRDNPV